MEAISSTETIILCVAICSTTIERGRSSSPASSERNPVGGQRPESPPVQRIAYVIAPQLREPRLPANLGGARRVL